MGYIDRAKEFLLMRDRIQSILANTDTSIDPNGSQVLIMGTALIAFNLLLMFCLGIYWINPSVHQYLSGKPL